MSYKWQCSHAGLPEGIFGSSRNRIQYWTGRVPLTPKEHKLAESQKPPGLVSIGADEGVRIHILSGRACKTYVKLIWNIDFYASGTYVMRMWSVCAAQVKTYVSRMWIISETYAKYMWHINVFWDWIALCLRFTYVYVCEFMCFFMSEEK